MGLFSESPSLAHPMSHASGPGCGDGSSRRAWVVVGRLVSRLSKQSDDCIDRAHEEKGARRFGDDGCSPGDLPRQGPLSYHVGGVLVGSYGGRGHPGNHYMACEITLQPSTRETWDTDMGWLRLSRPSKSCPAGDGCVKVCTGRPQGASQRDEVHV